ncbi:MAG TPA: HD domain-containing phosphohydrolase, partial [Desulfurivibrionaceae bacterium]|nr:HD domain-containing phosphohydrolase [Desulfurivibrionaceae bacterium]
DISKITTPEFVVDKATKLETVFDRIELVRCRVEILKRDREIRRLKNLLATGGGAPSGRPAEEVDHSDLDEYLRFLEAINYGGESLSEESLGRIRKIAGVGLTIGGKPMPLLDTDEVTNLSIRQGTLTEEERKRVGNHVNMSIKMLEGLPFPKKLRRVPIYAGLHHEKLDGSGYPKGLANGDIPLPGRIMAVADIFEALTASDRPYKRGKRLSEAMRILEQMVHDRKLDGNVCDLLVESGLVAEYARESLAEWQMDDFEWRGKRYSARNQPA